MGFSREPEETTSAVAHMPSLTQQNTQTKRVSAMHIHFKYFLK